MRRFSLTLLAALMLAAAPRATAQTTGLIPLNDLGAGSYAGYTGGLYPGGLNVPPAAHLADALVTASGIVPRNTAGNPDPNGWIGMIAVGMSNTTHEFGAFERNADADPTRNARVVIVDTGQGGQTATIIANPNATYWTTMTNRLTAMGLTAAQVQVAWLKEAEAGPPNNFPVHAQALRDTLKVVVRNLHTKYPNLKICYLSSRIYGGYAPQGSLNPEPQAYESGFSVKWLIEDQINADPGLNHGQLPGPVRAPLLLWGPYLWADGVNPRSDGLTWPLSDLETDHVHPAPGGEQKVAGLLATFFAGDATAAAWWPKQPGERLVAVDAIHDAYVSASAPTTNYGSDVVLLEQGGAQPIHDHFRFDVSGESRPIQRAKLSLRVREVGGGSISRVDNTAWTEGAVTWASAPAVGSLLTNHPNASKDGTLGADVTSTVMADVDRQIGFALTTTLAGQGSYVSKEGGAAPRLVLVVTEPASGVGERPPSSHGLRLVGPNPTNGGARLAFDLAAPGEIEVVLLSVDGRRVRALTSGPRAAGPQSVAWDGRDDAGRDAGPGIFFVRLRVGESIESVRIVRTR